MEATTQSEAVETIELKYRAVGFGRLINTGNYENERLYLEAEVPPGCRLDQVVGELRRQLNQLLVVPREELETFQSLQSNIRSLQTRLRTLQQEYDQSVEIAAKTWKEILAILKANGVELETPWQLERRLFDLLRAVEAPEKLEGCFGVPFADDGEGEDDPSEDDGF